MRNIIVYLLLASVQAQNQYLRYLENPEPYRVFRNELKPPAFKEPNTYHKSAGFATAGAAEFPWVVDIRGTHYDQMYWATGNLISSIDVITSCRAVFQLSFFSRDSRDIEYLKVMYNESLKFQPVTGLRVSFAPNFLWEEYNTPWDPKHVDVDADPFEKQKYVSGSRLVDRLFVHINCDLMTSEADIIRYDNGGLRLQHPIYALPPQLSYMPMPLAYEASDISIKWNKLYLTPEDHIADRVICYVASIGRRFNNWEETTLLDYKVKYRVYAEKWLRCIEADNLYHYEYHHCFSTFCGLWVERPPELMCYASRSEVGAVCEHDRGAPVVCNGRVYGFVSTAVPQEFCSNRIPLPFVVIKLSVMKNIYLDIQKPVFTIDEKYVKLVAKKHATGTKLSHPKYPFFIFIAILKLLI